MEWSRVEELAVALPEVERAAWFGTPSLKVRGISFARLREPDVMVLLVDMEQREALIQSDPEKFFITPHYANYPSVLIRLSAIDEDEIADLLEDSWWNKAPKRLQKAHEGKPLRG
jgi:hypothetical protein